MTSPKKARFDAKAWELQNKNSPKEGSGFPPNARNFFKLGSIYSTYLHYLAIIAKGTQLVRGFFRVAKYNFEDFPPFKIIKWFCKTCRLRSIFVNSKFFFLTKFKKKNLEGRGKRFFCLFLFFFSAWRKWIDLIEDRSPALEKVGAAAIRRRSKTSSSVTSSSSSETSSSETSSAQLSLNAETVLPVLWTVL